VDAITLADGEAVALWVDAGVIVVEIVAGSALCIGHTGAAEESRELGVGHRQPVHGEGAQYHPMGRPLVGEPGIVAHGERTAGKFHHVVGGVGAAGGESGHQPGQGKLSPHRPRHRSMMAL